MIYIPEPFVQEGEFLRGNIHAHSHHSDGVLVLEEVVKRYRDSGYDFLGLTDHFLPAYNFPLVDVEPWQYDDFSLIRGVELHAPRTENSDLWHITAIGIPADFAPRGDDEDGPAIARRAADAGAFISLVHPAWYSLSLNDAETITAAHAVEVYNHGCQLMHDKGDGAYLLDGLLDRGKRLLCTATDDAHFRSPEFGGAWLQVKAPSREHADIVNALKQGHFYSTQGPEFEHIHIENGILHVHSTSAMGVLAVGTGYLSAHQYGTNISRFRIDLSEQMNPSPWLRIVLTDHYGRRAWTNPIWKEDLGLQAEQPWSDA